MGNLCGGDASENVARKRSQQIDDSLRKANKEFESVVKLLLLGAGESGKSTIVKQMKIINLNGYSLEERQKYKEVVYSNTLNSMKVLIIAAERLGIPLDSENMPSSVEIAELPLDIELVDEWATISPLLVKLWADGGIQKAFARSSEFQLNDSAPYYFDALERISKTDYVPTEQDVLRTRVRTTGIVETSFKHKDVTFKMFDVGGQRNERKKWIHCFQGVTAVIFVTSLSEYDQKLFEDENQNRMVESLALFDEICNSRWFKDTSMILFLNKTDLFRAKLQKVPLTVSFPEYEGEQDFQSASQFIIDKFLKLNRNQSKPVYPHLTCATDTESIKFVFESVKETILNTNYMSNPVL